jgi:hypothetical protein
MTFQLHNAPECLLDYYYRYVVIKQVEGQTYGTKKALTYYMERDNN